MRQDKPQLHSEAKIHQDLVSSSSSETAIPAESIGSNAPLTDAPMDPAPPVPQADIPFLGHVLPELVPPVRQAPLSSYGIINPVAGPFFTVSSGGLLGRLHLECFKCPGIHEPCIEFQGALITPKEFACRAGMERQKDWKVSIRIGARTLHFMMEQKVIDFYNHKEKCTGKCHSRYYGHGGKINNSPRNLTTATVNRSDSVRSVRVPVYSMAPTYHPPYHTPYRMPVPRVQQMYHPMQNPMAYRPPQMSIVCAPVPRLYPLQMFHAVASGNLVQEGEMTYTVLGRPTASPAPAVPGVMTTEHLMNMIKNDPVMFWNEARRAGLLPHFLQSIGNNVSALRLLAMDPDFDIGIIAPTLNSLIDALELKPYVVSRIQMNQTAYNGPLPCGAIKLPHEHTDPCCNQAPVPNPSGTDLSSSRLQSEDGVVDSEGIVANTECEDLRDRPLPPSPGPAPKRRRLVVNQAESDEEE